jgi:AbiU2
LGASREGSSPSARTTFGFDNRIDQLAKDAVARLSSEERIDLAKKKTSKLVDNALHLMNLHEANRIILYSPALSSQIRPSYAANAFNVFTDAFYKFEVIRLCVLWDPRSREDLDVESIPAVVDLIKGGEVLERLRQDTWREFAHWPAANLGRFDESEREMIEQAMRRHQEAFATERTQYLIRHLGTAIRWAEQLADSELLNSVRNARNKHLAHSVAETRLEKRQPVANMRYGDERRLLWKSLAIINALYLVVNGTGFDWKGSIEIAKNNAQALWQGCEFKVLR